MTLKALAAALVALPLAIGTANALSLTNNDKETYTVQITMTDGSSDEAALEAGQSVDNICENGCTIRLNNGTEQAFDGTEAVTIQDGTFLMGE